MHNYNFNNIFSVRTNTDYFDGLLHAFRDDQEAKISLRFFLDENLSVSTAGKNRVNLMLYYNTSDCSVEFMYPWIRPICAKFIFREDPVRCDFVFNGNYLRLSNLIAEGWELIDVFRSLLAVALIQRGMYVIHGAAIGVGNQGILVPSFGNTGKTTTSWMLAKRGAAFLTDEFAILDEVGRCLGFPCSSLVSSALVKQAALRLSLRQRLALLLNDTRSKVFSTRLFQGGLKLQPNQHFQIGERTKIEKVVFIQNGTESIQEIDKPRALAMIRAIQSYEMNWRANPFLIAQSFFDSRFNVDEICSREKEVLETQVSRIPEFYVVSSFPGRHYEFIEKLTSRSEL